MDHPAKRTLSDLTDGCPEKLNGHSCHMTAYHVETVNDVKVLECVFGHRHEEGHGAKSFLPASYSG